MQDLKISLTLPNLDQAEAFALLRKHIYHTAPVTHRIIPKLTISEAFRAAFDPEDDPINAPKQSVSEQQQKSHIIPIHGLKMWDVIVRFVYLGSKHVSAQLNYLQILYARNLEESSQHCKEA